MIVDKLLIEDIECSMITSPKTTTATIFETVDTVRLEFRNETLETNLIRQQCIVPARWTM